MVTVTAFKQVALSFEEAAEQPHFEKTSFRINKKIFATLHIENEKATLKFSEADQAIFCLINKDLIYPAGGSWGKKGWTVVELKGIKTELLKQALTAAYCNTAPPRLAEKYKPL